MVPIPTLCLMKRYVMLQLLATLLLPLWRQAPPSLSFRPRERNQCSVVLYFYEQFRQIELLPFLSTSPQKNREIHLHSFGGLIKII